MLAEEQLQPLVSLKERTELVVCGCDLLFAWAGPPRLHRKPEFVINVGSTWADLSFTEALRAKLPAAQRAFLHKPWRRLNHLPSLAESLSSGDNASSVSSLRKGRSSDWTALALKR